MGKEHWDGSDGIVSSPLEKKLSLMNMIRVIP